MLHVLALLATALVLGGMAFFSFVMAPLVFRQLEKEAAAAFMGAAFPRYYDTMTGAAAVGTALAAPVELAACILMGSVALAFILMRRVLLPSLNRHREARQAGDTAADAAFKRLHGLSMVVNLAQLIAVVVAMVRLAM